MERKIRKPLVWLMLAAGLGSCGEKAFFEGNEPIAGTAWKRSDVKVFTVEVDDTISHYDFFIDLRHTESYPYSNIYFFMTVTLPNNQRVLDTVGYYMQDAESHWLGNHSGSLITHRVLVKPNSRFPRKGRYRFSLRQAMRDSVLQGVSDIGITLKKREHKN